MRRWAPLVITAVAVLGDIALGAIAAAQNAQLIQIVIPQRYLAADYLLGGYGVALLLVYFAAKATHPSPAAIRASWGTTQTHPFIVTNIGETEATAVSFATI